LKRFQEFGRFRNTKPQTINNKRAKRKHQTTKMKLEILTPEQKIFTGDVYGIQLPGIQGLFEVLDKHAPMVSALKAGSMKVLTDKTNTTSYTIQGGFVEVLNNKATVLVEGAVQK
jgi:F-type H+-transporting ATPase subunit epsilon